MYREPPARRRNRTRVRASVRPSFGPRLRPPIPSQSELASAAPPFQTHTPFEQGNVLRKIYIFLKTLSIKARRPCHPAYARRFRFNYNRRDLFIRREHDKTNVAGFGRHGSGPPLGPKPICTSAPAPAGRTFPALPRTGRRDR